MLNLALDRIEALEELPDEPFVEDPGFNPETWFDDLVGVTKSPEDRPQKIRFWSSVEKMRARDPLTRQRLTPVRNFRLTLVA